MDLFSKVKICIIFIIPIYYIPLEYCRLNIWSLKLNCSKGGPKKLTEFVYNNEII